MTINGSISPLTISVTHPINVAYAISPDAETFTAPDITVTNNTKVAVIATVERKLNLQYRISGHLIQVKSLNLGADWTEIYQRLIELVKTGNHLDETLS